MQLLSMCGIFFYFLFQRKYATIFFNPLSSMKHYCHGPGTHVKSCISGYCGPGKTDFKRRRSKRPGQYISEEFVEILLANVADVNVKANDGATTLSMANRENDKSMAALLIENGAKE